MSSPVDPPGPAPEAGLSEYTDIAVQAAHGRSDIVLVAASLGGITAAMAAERLPVSGIVLVNAMIPLPGKTPGAWWDHTGAVAAREAGGYGPLDLTTYFLPDIDRAGLRERLGILADVRPGGHLIALAEPQQVADYLRRGLGSAW